MLQSPWSGFHPRTFDPTPLPLTGGPVPSGPGFGVGGIVPIAVPGDGVAPQWWSSAPSAVGSWGYGASAGQSGGLYGIVQSLMAMVQQLLGALMSGGTTGSGTWGAGMSSPSFGQQRFQNVDISSTGDPHIAETGTAWGPNGATSVSQHYDDMCSQNDLVDTHDVAGGYRVSTTTTQPDARGVTYNASATVAANGGRDQITVNKDGSFSIVDYGQNIGLVKGQTVTLSGGETVTENQDGSLTVNASNARGGSISTTLRATGNGVDVTTHGHDIALGGSVVNHAR